MAKKRKKRRGKGRFKKGHRPSAATRKKISLAQKHLYRIGKHPFARRRKKIRAGRRKGRKSRKDQKAKKYGKRVRHVYGRGPSPETRAKLRAKAKARYATSALAAWNRARAARRGVKTPYLAGLRAKLTAERARAARQAELEEAFGSLPREGAGGRRAWRWDLAAKKLVEVAA